MTPETLEQIYQEELEDSYRANRLGSPSVVPLFRALNTLTARRLTIPDALSASGLSFSDFSEALSRTEDLGLIELYTDDQGESLRLTPSGKAVAAKLTD